MKNFLKKGVKEIGSFTTKSINDALSGTFSGVIQEVMEESGIKEELKSQLVSLGTHAIKESGVSPLTLGKEGLKSILAQESSKLKKK